MPCVKILDEIESWGWFGMASGDDYGSRQLTPFMDGLLLRKADSTPARRYQLFKLSMDGKLDQLTEGPEEVVRIIKVQQTKIYLSTTGPNNPGARHVKQIDMAHSAQNYNSLNPDNDLQRNSEFSGNSEIPLNQRPCQWSEVTQIIDRVEI